MGATWYQSVDKTVDIRARQLPKAYRDKARHIDKAYCGIQEGQVGPIQQRLESYGDLGCFVVGQFCKGSQDIDRYLKTCAKHKAFKLTRMFGTIVSQFQGSQILQQVRRRLSVCSVRAHAACLLSCLGHIKPEAKEATERRSLAR